MWQEALKIVEGKGVRDERHNFITCLGFCSCDLTTEILHFRYLHSFSIFAPGQTPSYIHFASERLARNQIETKPLKK